MTLTSGFFNSVSLDRLYDAIDMSRLFDGIIYDGVFESVGDYFHVAPDSGMDISVGSGRAWFDSTWTYNDSEMILTVSASNPTLPRIDTVYLEVNKDTATRANSIDIAEGNPSESPVPPTLTNNGTIEQHPLAYITVSAGATQITIGYIQNLMGTELCPFVTGPLSGNIIDHDHSAGYGGPIVSAGIGAQQVLTANIGLLAITEALLYPGAVSESKLGSLAVTNGKIGANAVNYAKLGAGAPQLHSRRGGNGTNWDIPGATPYTTANLSFEVGSIQWTGTAASQGSIGVGFTTAFTGTPIVIATCTEWVGVVVSAIGAAPNGVTLWWRNTIGTTIATCEIQYIVVGPVA